MSGLENEAETDQCFYLVHVWYFNAKTTTFCLVHMRLLVMLKTGRFFLATLLNGSQRGRPYQTAVRRECKDEYETPEKEWKVDYHQSMYALLNETSVGHFKKEIFYALICLKVERMIR